jgi:hypothetical protein
MVHQLTALLRSILAVLVISTLMIAPARAHAEPVSLQAENDTFWDDRFGMPGEMDSVYSIAVAANGSVYINKQGSGVMRWDGRAWQSIGNTGSGSIEALATIGNTLYAAGSFTSIGAFQVKYLAKWNGSVWEQVGSGAGPKIVGEWGVGDGSFTTLAAADGKLYVGGDFNHVDDAEAHSIAVWDGSSWGALGGGIRSLDSSEQPTEPGEVKTIVPVAGKLYVGGVFEVAGEQRAGSIAVWNGTSWSALGGGMLADNGFGSLEPGNVAAIAVSGNIVYAGGQFSQAGGKAANNIAVWNGTSWNALSNGLTGESGSSMGVRALLIEGASVLAGGEFTFAGGQTANNFARWDGTAWTAVGSLSQFDYVQALVAAPGGGYYIGGDFDKVDGLVVVNIALRTGASWQALGQGLTATGNNCCVGKVYAVVNDGAGHVYVGGRFQTAGGIAANNIAMWDGSSWHPLGAGVAEGDVRALLLLGDDLYVGGDFKSAGNASIPYIAKWSITSGQWSGLGSGVNGSVYALEEADGTLYVGGDMSAAGGVKVSNIAAWDGAQWSALSEKLVIREIFDNCSEAGTQVYAIKASGRYLAIAGRFRLVQIGFEKPCLKESYFPANNILLWDRIADEWFFMGKDGSYGVTGGGTIFPSVNALEVVGGSLDAGGKLYVGGDFTQAGLIPAQGLAAFKLQGGWEQAGGVSAGTGGLFSAPGVSSLKAAGSDLYIGGNFTKAGSGEANYVVRYSTANGSWIPLGSGTDSKVLALDTAPDGLYIGGEFSKAGGRAAAAFSRWGVPISTGNVTPEGGTVEGDGISISFPAGAVGSTTTVIYTPQSAPLHSAPAGKAVVRAFRFEAKAANGQQITQFGQPYTLRVSYNDQMLAAAGVDDPLSLTLAYWNGTSWVSMLPCQGCGVDTANKVITVVANHFTEFAVFGKSNTYTVFLPLTRR